MIFDHVPTIFENKKVFGKRQVNMGKHSPVFFPNLVSQVQNWLLDGMSRVESIGELKTSFSNELGQGSLMFVACHERKTP